MTYHITDEPIDFPPTELGRVLIERDVQGDGVHVPALGERVLLAR